jgi:hypothetical protein
VKRHGRAAAGAPNPNQGAAGGVAAGGATAGGFIPQSSSVELCEKPLDKHFGYPKNFSAKYELGHEVGRGHFGHTCFARIRKGDLKGQPIAVKIISKAKVSISSSSCCISSLSLSLSQHLPSKLALLHVIVSLLQLKKKIHSSCTAAATYIPSGFIHILSPSPSLLVSPSKLFLSSLCNTKLIVLVTNTARNKVPTIIVIACAFSLPLSSPLKLFNVVTSSTETQRTSSYCHCKYSSSFTPL